MSALRHELFFGSVSALRYNPTYIDHQSQWLVSGGEPKRRTTRTLGLALVSFPQQVDGLNCCWLECHQPSTAFCRPGSERLCSLFVVRIDLPNILSCANVFLCCRSTLGLQQAWKKSNLMEERVGPLLSRAWSRDIYLC